MASLRSAVGLSRLAAGRRVMGGLPQARFMYGNPGHPIPNVALHKGFPPEKVKLNDFCKGKKVVLVGVPGAFTPTCSSKHVPGYVAKAEELKKKGVSDVVIVAVNDGAVMHAWAKDQGLQDSDYFHFLGDAGSELTNALRMVFDDPGAMAVLGNPRCKRFSMLIEDGVIKKVNLGPPDEVSFAEQMLVDLE